jgi:shikimate kinase
MKIFLIGFMGCGKTHWGKLLSEKLGLPFFDLDEQISEHEGKSISEIFDEEGEEYFRVLEKDVLHRLTESNETFVMACGGGAPCFYNTIDYLRKKGLVVWFNCSTEGLYQRLIKEKEDRPLLRDIPNAQLKSYIVRKYSARKIYYQQAGLIVNEEELTLDQLISTIFHA